MTSVTTAIAMRVQTTGKPLYLNLGSGPRGLDSARWVNIDGYPDRNVHYLVDFSRPLPIPDDSFDGVFSEHVQEHFTLQDGIALLSECLRVLLPGGRIRLIMPDAEKILRTYLDNPTLLVSRRPVESGEAMESVNSFFRQRYEHQCLYDFGLARNALESAGFVEVARVTFGTGACPQEMILDDPKYQWESLYIEARKPHAAAAVSTADTQG